MKRSRDSRIDQQVMRDIQDLRDSGYATSDELPDTPSPRYARVMSPERGRTASHSSAQLHYNRDRALISRSIAAASDVAKALKDRAADDDWPLLLPSVARPGVIRTETDTQQDRGPKRQLLKRTQTSMQAVEESLTDLQTAKPKSAQGSHALQLLNPSLLLHTHGPNLISAINPKAVGEVMSQQLDKTIKHLGKLRIRVEDTSSKVLVTGDLNAGKSTLCNALLRQQVMPVDQQPCTEVFCEVLDARDNGGELGVHAVSIGQTYDQKNPESYTRLSYDDLPTAVTQIATYSALKVYVHDQREIEQSLLRNGVVDIALIDAPGLNSDCLKTTAVYAQQEEIDVVVFVVSAENHLTLSGKEFLWSAANEKAYLFVVVNKFDAIRDKDRCRKMILDQIAHLSPATHADAQELVHFVSAAAAENDPAFDELEVQLRNFILDKRAQSKLAPAKTFCSKFWSDVLLIARHNGEKATEERAKLEKDLLELQQQLSTLSHDRAQTVDRVSSHSEKTVEAIRQNTRTNVTTAMNALAKLKPEYPWHGLLDCWEYAARLRDQYMATVLHATVASELQARNMTASAVDTVRAIAATHLTEEQYRLPAFNASLMFSRKRDAIQRQVPIELTPLDFVDLTRIEAALSTTSLSAALVLYGTKTIGWSAAAESLVRVVDRTVGIEHSPRVVAAVLLCGFGAVAAYAAYQVPTALQTNLSRKCAQTLARADYPATQAHRISDEVRRVLSRPESDIRAAFASMVDARDRQRQTLLHRTAVCTATADFFRAQCDVVLAEQHKLAQTHL
ncbi:mitofusin [Savitreella phatthalungensis]